MPKLPDSPQPWTAPQWINRREFRLSTVHRYICRPPAEPVRMHSVGRCLSVVTTIEIKSADDLLPENLGNRLEEYIRGEDFNFGFTHGIAFCNADTELDFEIPDDTFDYLRSLGVAWARITPSPFTADAVLLPRPYLLDDGELLEIWRVRDDFNRAFLISTWPSRDGSGFENASMAGDSHAALGVPVPLRFYSRGSYARPLEGVRVAIKDIFDLKGVRTSLCNRAFHDLYPPQDTTAACVQELISLGAVIVGKTHLSSFAWREEPTQCVDYQAPFNPRGDGYLSPAGSSSGSAAAIASYDWLDFALGTDTTGSGRRPGLWNGCFALRPSLHVLPGEGMIPTCLRFDTPSLFGRDITAFKHFISCWYADEIEAPTNKNLPWKILYPTDYLPVSNSSQMRVFDDLVESLSEHLDTVPCKMSIADCWAGSAPVEEKNLTAYLSNIQTHGFFYDLYHSFDTFRNDYRDIYEEEPYVTDTVKWVWGLGKLFNESQRNTAFERLSIFSIWFLDRVMEPQKQNTLVLLPIETLEPRYRDLTPETPTVPPEGLSALYLSPALGAPELVVPVGQIPYESKVTGQTEQLPVAVAVMGAPRTDELLVQTMEEFLVRSGRPTKVPTKVPTGRRMYAW